MNEIQWHNKARKQLLKLQEKYRSDIINNIETLVDFPKRFPGNVKKLKKHHYEYRMRVGRYRILFDYKDVIKVISIEEIRKRDERTY